MSGRGICMIYEAKYINIHIYIYIIFIFISFNGGVGGPEDQRTSRPEGQTSRKGTRGRGARDQRTREPEQSNSPQKTSHQNILGRARKRFLEMVCLHARGIALRPTQFASTATYTKRKQPPDSMSGSFVAPNCHLYDCLLRQRHVACKHVRNLAAHPRKQHLQH